MDFKLTSEQQALADSVGRFCEREYGFAARTALIECGEGMSRAHWSKFAELGWLGAGLSEDMGGFGGGPVENAIIMEAFGRALVIEPFMPCALLALQTLAAVPAGPERDELIESTVAGGTLLALAHGEPAACDNNHQISATAVKTTDGWCITGHKSVVVGAPFAEWLLVSANTSEGMVLLLVRKDADGVRLQPFRTIDNVHVADIWFDGTIATGLLADGDIACEAIAKGFAHALTGICAEAVGAMSFAMTMTRDYIKLRKQFGVTLNNFQALQHRMADMLVEVEVARSILYQGLAAINESELERARAMAAMKAVVSSAALFVGRNAVQLHGGIGLTEEHAIGHYYRRLFVIASQFGGESHHLRTLALNARPIWSDV